MQSVGRPKQAALWLTALSGCGARFLHPLRSRYPPPNPIPNALTHPIPTLSHLPSPFPAAATAAPARKLLQGWPEPPINVRTSAGPLTIRRYPWSVQNIVGLNVALPNPILRGRGSH
jgi:hypothetical protein